MFILATGGALAVAANAQLPQLERIRKQRDRAIQAEQQREEDRRRKEAGLPTKNPKPAVMNVDVQAVVSKADAKNFAEAKPQAAVKVADGDPLWLYVKFNGKLGDYVLTVPTDDPEAPLYILYAEIGPAGDATTLQRYTLQFAKEDLAATELKLGLAPALQGRNRSLPVFLNAAGTSRPGVWNNELRLTNNISIPRGAADNLTKNPLTFSFAGAVAKYPRMAAEYDSVLMRGTPDESKLPMGSGFFDADIKAKVEAKLQTDGIAPDKVYFAGGDTWMEFAGSADQLKRHRKAFAVYTRRSGDACSFGVAKVEQVYEDFTSKFSEPAITLEKEQPLPCTQMP